MKEKYISTKITLFSCKLKMMLINFHVHHRNIYSISNNHSPFFNVCSSSVFHLTFCCFVRFSSIEIFYLFTHSTFRLYNSPIIILFFIPIWKAAQRLTDCNLALKKPISFERIKNATLFSKHHKKKTIKIDNYEINLSIYRF